MDVKKLTEQVAQCKKESKKSEIDKIFTLVDKASRNALREIEF